MAESDPGLGATLAADARPPTATLHAGATVGGRYNIRGLLGAGGMGAVYLAYDEVLAAQVALKLVEPGLAGSSDGLRRLRDEVLLAQQVTSPHVCRTYDLAEVDGLWLVKMEHIDGETLADRLARGRLEISEGLEVARQVALGLAAAHHKGVVHRDLKPHNVMIERGTRRVVLMDFGLARRVAPGDAHEVSGTPAYMSPEQIFGREVDPRSDLYSLGCLLWHALVGEVVFPADTQLAVMRRQLEDRPPDPRALRPELPAWLARTLLTLLEKDASRRPADAAAALASLRPARPLWLRLGVPLVALAGVAAALVAGGVFTPAWQPVITPHLPAYEENSDGAAVSPDGRWIAYASDRERTNFFRLYVAPFAGGRPRVLTPPHHNVAPYVNWSQSGDALLYVTLAQRGEAYSIPVEGGEPTLLLPQVLTVADCGGRLLGVDPSAPGCPTCPRFITREGDGTAREVHRFDSGDWIYNPRCDPSGERVIYGLAEQQQEFAFHAETDIWSLSLSGGPPRRLTDDRRSFDPVVHPDGRSLVYARTDAHRTNLWELPLDGGEPVQLTTGEGNRVRPAISPDGEVLLFNLDETSTPLFVHTGGQRRKLTSSKADLRHMRVAPDGRELYAESGLISGARIVAVAVDSGEEHVLAASGIHPAPTLDGAEVVFAAGAQLLAVPRSGGEARTLAEIDGKVAALDIGGDGHVHLSLTRGGAREAWRVPLAGGIPEREAPAPWCQVVPAPVGGWKLAVRCESMIAMRGHLVAPGADLDETSAASLTGKVLWEASGASLISYDMSWVRRFDISSGATTDLLELPIAAAVAIAPDGAIYSAEIVSHVTRHLITNYGDRPRP